MRFLIIGNSAAGIGALEAIRKIDREAAITIVTEEDYPTYSRCLLSYLLAGSIEENDLVIRPHDFHRSLGADLVMGKRIESIDPSTKQAICEDNTSVAQSKINRRYPHRAEYGYMRPEMSPKPSTSLLGRKVDVSGYRDDLLRDDFDYKKIIRSGGRRELSRLWNAGHRKGGFYD